IHLDVAVVHQLARRPDSGRKAEPVHHAIQTGFEQHQQVGTRDAAHALGSLKGAPHLAFHQGIVHANPLLVQQLLPVHRMLAPQVLSVLARRKRALHGRAFRIAPHARTQPAAYLVFWSCISGHSLEIPSSFSLGCPLNYPVHPAEYRHGVSAAAKTETHAHAETRYTTPSDGRKSNSGREI